jgi:hypothetical protein
MKKYKSKVDILFLILPLTLPVLFLSKQILNGDLQIILPVIIGVLVVDSILYYFTEYTITNGSINVRGGFFINKNIHIGSISKISKNKNQLRRSVLRNPILTNDCLDIYYDENKSILISPDNEEQFLKDIQKVNPNLVIS